jgi:hypothetical protein
MDKYFKENNYDIEKMIPKLKCAVKLIHGTNDKLFNIEQAHELYDKLTKKLPPVWLEMVGHQEILHKINPEDLKIENKIE